MNKTLDGVCFLALIFPTEDELRNKNKEEQRGTEHKNDARKHEKVCSWLFYRNYHHGNANEAHQQATGQCHCNVLALGEFR